MYLINGGLIEKYGYTNINVKAFTLAEKHPRNINTFMIGVEKMFLIEIPEEEYTSEKLNELIEEHLRNEEERIYDRVSEKKSKRKSR